MPRTTTRVCPKHGCPNLMPCENPEHGSRPKNAHWSADRDRTAQHAFRQALRARANDTCERCGHADPSGRTLVAHHDRPGYHPTCGRLLCTSCHRDVDTHAR